MDIRHEIRDLVRRHPLVLFMKGTSEYPMCAASARAAEALRQAEVPFHAVDVQQNPRVRAGLPRYSNWPEFPQLFVQGDLIGGCEVVVDLLESGELARLAHDLAAVNA